MTKREKLNGQDEGGTPNAGAGKRLWEKAISPSVKSEEANLPRLLNGILLILIALGVAAVVEYGFRQGFIAQIHAVPVTAMALLTAAFLLNRRGYFRAAVLLSLGTITLSVFGTLWLFHGSRNDYNILFYLVVPILFAEFFLPLAGYIVVSALVLAGLILTQPYDPAVKDITSFMMIFSFLVGASGYYSQKLEKNHREWLLAVERRHARQMELLNSITHASLNTDNLQEMTQILADRMGDLLGADGTFLTLWDEANDKSIPAAASGKYRPIYPTLKFRSDEKTLTRSVLEAGHPLVIEDVMNTPHMSRSIAERFSSRSLLALPLIANERKMGAALIAFDQPHRFSAWEIELGERAATQIALALYKSHLLEVSLRQVNQLELFSEVSGQIANSLDEKEILEYTLEAVVTKFGYAEAAISLLMEDDIMEVAAINGTQDFGYRPGFRQEIGKGIIGHVAATRQPYVTGDVSGDPYYFSTAEHNGSALCVPMLDKEELLGTIYVESTRSDDFNLNDVRTLQTLANQVANLIQKARLYASTQEHLQATTILQSVSQAVNSTLDLEEILHNVIKLLQETFSYTYISIYLLQENRLRLGAQVGYPEELIIHEIPLTSGITGRTVTTKRTQFIPDVSRDSSFLRASQEVKSEICVPLIKKDAVLGVLNVESTGDAPLDGNDLSLLNAIAGPITIAIDNARLHAQVKSMAMTDAVSGLFNRHAFEDMLETEIQRAIRYGDQISLIIFDIDSFKEYNDTWGHPAGDERLRGTADLIRANQRKCDIAARYGGDEFAIILPSTDKDGAHHFARRLLDAARNSAPAHSANGKMVSGYTLSLGYATFPQDGGTAAKLLLAADQAELTAKRLGKNQIAAAGD